MGNLLIDERPLVLLPSLIQRMGFERASIVQQIHWLLQQPNNGVIHNEHKWVWGTHDEWCTRYFPFWKPQTLRKHIARLEKAGIIISEQIKKETWDRTKYYRLDYTHDSLQASAPRDNRTTSKRYDHTTSKRDNRTTSKRTDHTASSITKRSSKTSSERASSQTKEGEYLPGLRMPRRTGGRARQHMLEDLKAQVEAHGIDMRTFTALVNHLLESFGQRAVADGQGDLADRAHSDAQQAMLALLAIGVRDADEIDAVWKYFKADSFWANKRVSYQKFVEIAGYLSKKGGDHAASETDSEGGAQPPGVEREELDERQRAMFDLLGEWGDVSRDRSTAAAD